MYQIRKCLSGCGSFLNLIYWVINGYFSGEDKVSDFRNTWQAGSCVNGTGMGTRVLSHVATFFIRYSRKPWQPLKAQHGLWLVVVILIPLLTWSLILAHFIHIIKYCSNCFISVVLFWVYFVSFVYLFVFLCWCLSQNWTVMCHLV